MLVTLAASAALAEYPSARLHAGLVYNPGTTRSIMFGGEAPYDSGTLQRFDLNDTWEWTGIRWVRMYPSQSPPGRSAMAMVWDSNRNRVVVFSGRNYRTYLTDTWIYKDGQWSLINTPNAPAGRHIMGNAYDPIRDRVVVFGGSFASISTGGLTTATIFHDTWEFDGTTWTKRQDIGPLVADPVMAYDEARNQIIMLGINAKLATEMYAWDGSAGTWQKLTPATLPACTDGAAMTFETLNNTVLFSGGGCGTGLVDDETYEWDGSNWTKVDALLTAGALNGQALTFDRLRQQGVLFGGARDLAQLVVVGSTFIFELQNWLSGGVSVEPLPRSRGAFVADPVTGVVWLYGGLNESNTFYDFWQYANGVWQSVAIDDTGPGSCYSPAAIWDTDRSKLVMICSTADVFEWDGTAWKEFAATDFKGSNKVPVPRTFASAVYDPKLKKTVFFGGLDTNNSYRDDTWTWDGATWSEVKNNRPTSRDLTALFFDPVSQKTMLYGGLGRLTTLDRITRFDDMWSFDGSGWTKLTPAATPGQRYGMQLSLDPVTGHINIFGGLKVIPSGTDQVQVYMNDQWEWDGTTWKPADGANPPPPRENGGMAIDPQTNRLTIFGGYAGMYFGDIWVRDNGAWRVFSTRPVHGRVAKKG